MDRFSSQERERERQTDEKKHAWSDKDDIEILIWVEFPVGVWCTLDACFIVLQVSLARCHGLWLYILHIHIGYHMCENTGCDTYVSIRSYDVSNVVKL